MEEPRHSGLSAIVVIAVALLISLYVPGYFALSESIPNLTAGAGTVRVFRHKTCQQRGLSLSSWVNRLALTP